MTGSLAVAYKSGAQQARVVTEAWGEKNLFCPNCSSPRLTWLEPGHPASDYSCPQCKFWYQLKSQKSRLGDTITDGAYDAMMNAIRRDELPSMYFMQYEIAPPHPGLLPRGGEGVRRTVEGEWIVRNLLLVPHFAFPPSAIIKRKPLSPSARRAGWVGCNFALNRIPAEARIPVVITRSSSRRRDDESQIEKPSQRLLTSSPTNQTIIIPPEEVREKFKRVKPLREIGVKERGWTLDVLSIVRRLIEERGSATRSTPENLRLTESRSNEFTTSDTYAFERELEQLHPDNRNVKAKIRQQLQELRDRNLLLHIDRNRWRLP